MNESFAQRLHDRVIVFDAHTDTLQRVVMENTDLGRRSEGNPLVERADFPRYHEGGVNAQIFAVWVDTIYLPNHGLRRAMQQIDGFHRVLETNRATVGLARTASDIRRLVDEGRFAALLSIEGGDAIENDLGVLRMFYRCGASSMTLCHSRSTDWIDSSTDEPRWNGLNDFGRGVIHEMNRLGMIVDVSHTSDQAVRDVLATSEDPIIASHSCCKALNDHPRNLSDDLLEEIADAGGVIGINFYSGFLDAEYNRQLSAKYPDIFSTLNAPSDVANENLDKVAKERLYELAQHRVPRPPFATILDHIDHAVEVAGIDHVGLGTDLDVPHLSTPVDFDDVTHFRRVTEGLVERGYDEDAITKILGENFLRIFKRVTEKA